MCRREEKMSRFKMFAFIALISLAFGIALVGNVMAGERGKVVFRDVHFATGFPSAKVPDTEGHAIYLLEAKGMSFSEKWGPCLFVQSAVGDYTKGLGPYEVYVHYTYPDGSTITAKVKGEAKSVGKGITGGGGGGGTWTYIKGTGRFEGIQGGGTGRYWVLGPGQWYSDSEGEYTLP
jgi:hypothetical protein